MHEKVGARNTCTPFSASYGNKEALRIRHMTPLRFSPMKEERMSSFTSSCDWTSKRREDGVSGFAEESKLREIRKHGTETYGTTSSTTYLLSVRKYSRTLSSITSTSSPRQVP